jgi:hypothetical protein
MKKKVAGAVLVSSALMLPSDALAGQQGSGGEIFPNRGACEFALKQFRNAVRQVVAEPGTVGSVNVALNPAIKAVCQTVNGPDGAATGYEIVET